MKTLFNEKRLTFDLRLTTFSYYCHSFFGNTRIFGAKEKLKQK